MQFKIPHKQSEEEAIAYIKKTLDTHRADIAKNATDVQEEWNGNTLAFGFTAQGSRIKGTLTVRDKEFEVYAKLPLMLRMFEGRIQKMIHEQVAKVA